MLICNCLFLCHRVAAVEALQAAVEEESASRLPKKASRSGRWAALHGERLYHTTLPLCWMFCFEDVLIKVEVLNVFCNKENGHTTLGRIVLNNHCLRYFAKICLLVAGATTRAHFLWFKDEAAVILQIGYVFILVCLTLCAMKLHTTHPSDHQCFWQPVLVIVFWIVFI